jgi:hypothetical protein
MKTPFPNAFTLNKLGLLGRPFPFSIAVTRDSGGMTNLDLCPQQVTHVADLIQTYAQETLLISDVDHGTLDRLDIVARGIKLPHVAYEQNVVAIGRKDLATLLGELGHWELHLLDHPAPPSPGVVERSALNHPPERIPDAHAAHRDFPAAGISLHSHDDCFLSIRCRQDGFLRAVLARSLETYAGTLLGKGTQPDISEVPREILDRLWTLPLTLTFLRESASVDSARVIMGFSRTEYSFTEKRTYPLAGRIGYDASSGTWSLARDVCQER